MSTAQAGVAGGSNTLLLPITSCTISSLGALSPVARCKTFDAGADGYAAACGHAMQQMWHQINLNWQTIGHVPSAITILT